MNTATVFLFVLVFSHSAVPVYLPMADMQHCQESRQILVADFSKIGFIPAPVIECLPAGDPK